MYRTILNDLLQWKDSKYRKPLLLTGVRQCGKTYILKEFGEKYFEDVAYINLEKNENAGSIFDYDYDTDRIIRELGSLITGKEIIPGKTLLIFDEIQACPRAITALKYFCEDMRQLHIACAGSLLGVAVKQQNVAFPVGKVDRIKMYPMSFEEFVIADGGEKYLSLLQNLQKDRPVPDLCSGPMMKYLKNYWIIGGMPEAVSVWAENHNYSEADMILENILTDYSDDFSKHAPLSEVEKISMIWKSVPKQLAKENNKFVFSHVKEGKRANELEDAMQWLVDAGLIYKTEMVSAPELPLSYCADATYFKVYMADVGLLRKLSGVSYKTILDGAEEYTRFKGAAAENYVLTEMICKGKNPYFWRSGNSAEVDFLIEDENRIIPIEVKSADNTMAKSLRLFYSRYHPAAAVKISAKNCAVNDENGTEIISLPLYLTWNLQRYISTAM